MITNHINRMVGLNRIANLLVLILDEKDQKQLGNTFIQGDNVSFR